MWEPRWQASDVEISESVKLYSGFHTIVKHTFRYRQFDGHWSSWHTQEQVQRRNAVVVLLMDPDAEKVVLIEQCRTGLFGQKQRSPWLLECVAGLIDPGETPEMAARREALEEANCVAQELKLITRVYPTPGAFSECTHIFCATVRAPSSAGVYGLQEEGENILVHTIPYSEIPQLIGSDHVFSATTLIALQWLLLQS